MRAIGAKKILNVALDCPLDQLFDYLPPGHSVISDCQVGARVLVPFGRTKKIGIIVSQSEKSAIDPAKLRPAIAILDPAPLLNHEALEFLRWVANYYHHPIGEVVMQSLPSRLRKEKHLLALSDPCCRLLMSLDNAIDLIPRAPRQQEMAKAIAAAGSDHHPLNTLRQQFPHSQAALKSLVAKKIIEITHAPVAPRQLVWREALYPLTTEQQAAIQKITPCLTQFTPILLDGVTGSGKTEIYLQLAHQVLQQGRAVMLLVPEIALTPQLEQHFRQRLGDCVAIIHSGLNASEQELSWQQARLGLAPLVMGTRSLVLKPIERLGLIIVDEEHDLSFKQQEGLRYSARDLAIMRAQRVHCPVILGSATPSLESLQNAIRKRYQHVRLTQRVGAARSPDLQVLDIRDQPLSAGIASPVLEVIRQTLDKKQQVLVFINRRGYAPVLSCYACGWLSDCHQCDAHQTMHRAVGLLICHHCGAKRPIPKTCPACGSPELHPLGQGTEKIADFLSAQFPDTPVLRIDRDTTARKNSLNDLLQQVHQADAAIMIGTQMLAKGHHFARLTLVCILDADTGLFSVDFRAAERMAQLLIQVAGRAGRSQHPGRVIIQSRYPEQPLLKTLVHEGYSTFAKVALAERLEASYPPFSYQVLIRAEGKEAEYAEDFLFSAAQWLGQHKQPQVNYWGPVPAPMARRVGQYRSHLLLQARQREPLHRLMRELRQYLSTTPIKNRVRWRIDVDPYDSY